MMKELVETRGGTPAAPDRTRPSTAAGEERKKGRHFGARRVADPRDAWLPPTRCTLAQRQAVEAAARAAGISLNAYQRLKLCGDAGPRIHRSKPGPDMVLLAQAKAAHGRNGGLLNQIAKQLNSYDFRGVPELLEMRAFFLTVLAEHRETSAALMRALGVLANDH
jgi:hypothetical protein